MHRVSNRLLVVAAAAVLSAATACSASSGGTTNDNTQAPDKTVTVGLLTDLTGANASAARTSVDGVKAGVQYAGRRGYTIKYVVGDTATNPTTALAAAQRLVTQDHVAAVIASSALLFAVTGYLTQHNVPVIGTSGDGPEWITSKNMFSAIGVLHTERVATTAGTFFKSQGVTSLGTVGYSISPTSSEAAKAAAESAKKAGIKAGYVNAAVPYGTTDVGPMALAMKNAGVDGLALEVSPNTSFAIITALRDEGVNIKAALLPTGYGGDLAQAGPGAQAAAQNAFFALGYEPVEMQTAATRQFAADLKAAGVTGQPTFSMYNAYASVGLLVRALPAAAGRTTSAALISALSGIHDFDVLGLIGNRRIDINDRDGGGGGTCVWVTKLQGKIFVPVKNATPVCGSVIPGVTVSPSS